MVNLFRGKYLPTIHEDLRLVLKLPHCKVRNGSMHWNSIPGEKVLENPRSLLTAKEVDITYMIYMALYIYIEVILLTKEG